jgi:lipoprotein-anchoring transpeptidase ErfK/SrfK
MMKFKFEWIVVFVLCFVLCGCTGYQQVRFPATRQASAGAEIKQQASMAQQKTAASPEISDWGWSERLITEDQLNSLEMKDPALTSSVSHQILARLNSKAEFHIYDDIRKQKPLRVPNDFRAFRDWTPLPRNLQNPAPTPKCILVVKNIPFIGWYENGKLVADSQVGLGVSGEETKSGVYKILDKAVEKYSLSYRNDLGEPAWMPWAMRIYGGVWIHAGDVSGPYCSHGCVMLPMGAAEELFHWTDAQTTVVVVDSLSDLNKGERGRVRSPAT